MAAVDVHGGWPALLGRLLARRDLTRDEAEAALATVLAGDATAAQIAGLIVALRIKGETVDEIAGMVDAMLGAAAPLELPEGTIDIVGTGGSPRRRERALNVSTMACIVAAAAGATVCKHGNVRASSTSGSFDLLGELGIGYDLDGPRLAAVVRDVGVGFCFARAYHPAMRHAGPVRAELGVPTVFNVLGPLSHPGRVRRQVLGVGDPALLELAAATLAARGATHSLVVHGADGLDELSLCGETRVCEVRDGAVVDRYEIDPEALGLAVVAPDAVPGGSPAENAAICREVFGGATGPARDIVVLNAGAGLYVAGRATSIEEGIGLAGDALDSGSARSTLERLVVATRA